MDLYQEIDFSFEKKNVLIECLMIIKYTNWQHNFQ